MENVKQHWTARSVDDFAYRIASDFVAQIENKLEGSGTGRTKFAKAIGVTPGRVSQVLNNPTLFNLKSMVSYADGAGMKVAVIAYEDDDPKNNRGPINAQVFTNCWERAGCPRDLFELSGAPAHAIRQNDFSSQSYYRHYPLTTPIANTENLAHGPIDRVVAGRQTIGNNVLTGRTQ
jgi:hypothetical protein